VHTLDGCGLVKRRQISADDNNGSYLRLGGAMANKTEAQSAASRSASNLAERRSHPRVHCDGNVELRRIPPAPPQSIFAKIRNLSEGGCFLETERPLTVGERLVMQITLDDLELRFIAEVRSAKADHRCRAGLEFVGMSADSLKKIKALIEAIAGEQLPSQGSAPNQSAR
jgi:hypothetical protein